MANAASKRKGLGTARPASAAAAARVTGSGVGVLCVDDHKVLVEGLKAQFAVDGRIHCVGYLSAADTLLDETDRLDPDVVLLDIEMPGADVFEMADRLRHHRPKQRFAFLSAHVRDGYISAAYRCGAWGYFAKSDELEDITTGLVEIARSRESAFVMGPKVSSRCLTTGGNAHKTPSPALALDALTNREVEVLRLIGKGLSRSEIATELCRSAKTIDGHQDRILKKLGVHSRAELMRLAIREGLAEA